MMATRRPIDERLRADTEDRWPRRSGRVTRRGSRCATHPRVPSRGTFCRTGRSTWLLALVLGCGSTAPPPAVHTLPTPTPGPVLDRDTPASTEPGPPPRQPNGCEDFPLGREASVGSCPEGQLACVQEPRDASLRGRALTLIRCFERSEDGLVDTGARLLLLQEAMIMMSADPAPDRVACFFSSPTEWATFPAHAQDAAYAWAACTERTTTDPF